MEYQKTNLERMLKVSGQELIQMAESHKVQYANAKPFPHIVFSDFFDPDYLKQIVDEFPDLANKKQIDYNNPNEKKLASMGESLFGPKTKDFVRFLNAEPFLLFLQIISAIKEILIPDPYFVGGGYHEIKPNGFLKLHADFHKNLKTNLDRRMNILTYLNEDWEGSYGGHLELWERDMSKKAVSILPKFNTLAMFSTGVDTWHGHPNPLTCPPNRSRRSLALYYYSKGRSDKDAALTGSRVTTTFVARKEEDSIKMKVFNGTVNLLNDWLPPAIARFMKKTFRKNK